MLTTRPAIPLMLCLGLALLGGPATPAAADEAAPAAAVAPAGDAKAAPAAESVAAAPALDVAQLRQEMHRFYNGERLGGVALMSIGAPALAAGVGLMFHPGEFERGLGYPVLAVGAVELLAGLVFHVSALRRVPRFDQQLSSRPAEFHAQELRHLRTINHRDMGLMEALEITLIMGSGTLTALGAMRNDGTMAGVGTGLLAQTLVLFVYDQLLARRAARYLDALTHFSVGVVSEPAGGTHVSLAPRGALLSAMGRF
jgi:hypothetical protein